ncbi:MlaD family protein [Helicobacter turcicus]|uniref:MlaD family protein n=1 Tax=Helicobacter turcicus TaxID=2867412 RepID=A0ABS7JMA6_9HELI|nr:MlaD family protein [Helicobacter turcicus]MBX7490526.1 MlaD family protein [Helicobacter turcicus]MBX7545385.1 MlaD family protein [Helicobacter turcicus]
MEARLNYALLGVFLVASLVALAGFVFWMGKYDRNLGAYEEYYLYNKELPKGIRIETPVRYLGLPVGFVKSYGLSKDQGRVEIVLWVKKEITLRQGTRAIVEAQGLTGGNYIALAQGNGEPFGKDSKAVIGFEENWIEKIGSKTGVVFDRLGVGLDNLNTLLSEKNLKNVEISLENIMHASTEFKVALNGFNSVLASTKETMKEIQKSSAFFNASLQRGDYNLRSILTPLLYQLEQNSIHLDGVLQSAQSAVEAFSSSPSGFLFEKQQEILGPRE